MKKLIRHTGKLLFFLFICIAVMAMTYIQTLFTVPGNMILLEGKEYVYNFRSPLFVDIKADRMDVIKLNDEKIDDDNGLLRLSSPISFKTEKKGNVNLDFKIFGFIPLKTVSVNVVADKELVACGNTVGVKMNIDGVLVIGVSDVITENGKSVSPAGDKGIKAGDFIVEINKKRIKSADELIVEINKSEGKPVTLKYRRKSSYNEITLTPVKSSDDDKYHIGLWVRDSTAGIGTITFYDPDTKTYGALGHGISDMDTGELMPVDRGEVIESNILAIKKGRAGEPGELKGVFSEARTHFGTIDINSECGIYGTLSDIAVEKLNIKMVPIGLKSEIKEGPATILANIDGKNVVEYDIEIEKIARFSLSNTKSMVIRITDKRLLDATGGIVQGMSGSPIIQNGKLIGAITHVLINDPARGYGIFIENMLKEAGSQIGKNIEKAKAS